MNTKTFKTSLLLILIIETASLLVFYFEDLYALFFLILSAIFAIFTWKDLKFGAFAILIELIIGSKGGDLFWLEIASHEVSIRMSIWGIFMIIWFFKFLLPTVLRSPREIINIYRYGWLKYFGIFMIFVLWGVIRALLQGNSPSLIFSDVNAYLFYLSVFPLFYLLYTESDKQALYVDLLAVIMAGLTWLSLKTFALLYLFSHNIDSLNSFAYHWVRDTGVGEITSMRDGFYRIFFQSHIYVSLALIPLFILLVDKMKMGVIGLRNIISFSSGRNILLLATTFCGVTFVSLSRSNWVGLIVAAMLVSLYLIWKNNIKTLLSALLLFFVTSVLSVLLIFLIVKFPIPDSDSNFSASKLFADRVSDSGTEAAVSSRWNLLGPLSDEIFESPILGKGFGETVTYISDDPRLRSSSASGEYTTFVFEWGWLDYWLKTGLLGFLSYVVFLSYLIIHYFWQAIKKHRDLDMTVSFSIILIALSAIHFFSPYLNHPLGIGMVVYLLFLFEIDKSTYLEQEIKNKT